MCCASRVHYYKKIKSFGRVDLNLRLATSQQCEHGQVLTLTEF